MWEEWIPEENHGSVRRTEDGRNGCPDTSLRPVLTSCMRLGKPASHFELYFPYPNNRSTHILHIHFSFSLVTIVSFCFSKKKKNAS